MYRLLSTMTWAEVAQLSPDSVVYVLPISSLEQHGRALPLGTDDFILQASLEELAKRGDFRHNFLQLPTLHYGSSFEHMDFPGTIAVSSSWIASLVEQVMVSMKQHGFRHLVIVNSHGGNTPVFLAFAQEWAQKYNIKINVISYFGSDFFADAQPILETPVSQDIHGGEIEAAYLEYAFPEVFRKEEALPERDVLVSLDSWNPGWTTGELAPNNGLLGAASRANKETGEKLFAYVADKLWRYFHTFDQYYSEEK